MPDLQPLPVGGTGSQTSGWWGMWTLIATEAALFGYLIFSYFYLASQTNGQWMPHPPKLMLASINTALLVSSSLVLHWGERSIRKGKVRTLKAALGITIIMGIVFVGIQLKEWHDKDMSLSDSAYASIYFTTTGFHMAHVVVGLLVLAALLLWAIRRKFSASRHTAVSIGAFYWHFVDVVWLAVFSSYYLLPHFS